jgi:hypothetical protein
MAEFAASPVPSAKEQSDKFIFQNKAMIPPQRQ